MAGIADDVRDPHPDDDELDEIEGQDEEELFDLAEVEEALGRSPMDDLVGRDDGTEDGTDGSPQGKDEDAEQDEATRVNPRTGQLRKDDGTGQWSADKAPVTPEQDEKVQPTEAATAPAEAGATKAGTAAPTDKAAPAAAAAPSVEEAAAAAAPSDAPIQTEAPAEPLRYRSNGRSYDLEGSRLTPEGDVVVSKDHVQALQLKLNRATYFEQVYPAERERAERTIRQLQTQRSEAETKFSAYMEYFTTLAREAAETDQYGEPTEKAQRAASQLDGWVQNIRVNLPVLEAKAERAYVETLKAQEAEPPLYGELEQERASGSRQQDGPDDAELERQLTEVLPKAIEQVREIPDYMGVSDAAAQAAMRIIRSTGAWATYFGIAERDAPEHGIEKGMILANHQALGKLLREQHTILVEASRASQAASQAAQRNAVRLGGRPGAPAAPQVNGTAGVATQQKPAASAGKVPLLPAEGDREAYDKWSALPLSVREASARQGRRAKKGEWSRDG